jgi:predicted transcriptional regulator
MSTEIVTVDLRITVQALVQHYVHRHHHKMLPDADTTAVLAEMNRGALSRLIVVDHGKLVGIIALKDILRFLSLKLDLEYGERRPFSSSS